MKIAVLVSGSGSNLQTIINAVENKQLEQVAIECVIADRNCFGLERAQQHHIPTYQFSRKDNTMFTQIDTLLTSKVDYIVLAGFLSILPIDFCQKWQNRIINLHPSLLPKYGGVGMYGDHVHRAVLENKEHESGATVHFVTGEVDQGAVLVQKACKIEADETIDSLKKKVQQIEHVILLEAIKKLQK